MLLFRPWVYQYDVCRATPSQRQTHFHCAEALLTGDFTVTVRKLYLCFILNTGVM
jgi:hypothetical protein